MKKICLLLGLVAVASMAFGCTPSYEEAYCTLYQECDSEKFEKRYEGSWSKCVEIKEERNDARIHAREHGCEDAYNSYSYCKGAFMEEAGCNYDSSEILKKCDAEWEAYNLCFVNKPY